MHVPSFQNEMSQNFSVCSTLVGTSFDLNVNTALENFGSLRVSQIPAHNSTEPSSESSDSDSDCIKDPPLCDSDEDVSDTPQNSSSESSSSEMSSKEQNFYSDEVTTYLKNQLKLWGIKNKITRSTGNALLEILKTTPGLESTALANLPKDFRSILQTRSIQIQHSIEVLETGTLAYFGVQNVLNSANDPSVFFDLSCTGIEVSINVDGLPISNSSAAQAWPILARVDGY